jgi:hypothetical protein
MEARLANLARQPGMQDEFLFRVQGFKFEFFSCIQRDTSNLKSGIHTENLVSHICKTYVVFLQLVHQLIFAVSQ